MTALRLPRSAAALAAALLLGAAGCSAAPGSGPATGMPLATDTATDTSTATSTDAASATATASAPSPTAAGTASGTQTGSGDDGAGSTALPTGFITIEQTVTDPDLGHRVTVHKIARSVRWPPGHTAEASAFELVAVYLTWQAGTAFTSSIRARDFALVTGSAYPNRVDPLLDATLVAATWPVLPGEVTSGQTASGWLVFRVDPKDARSIRLDWTRPATQISGTSTIFPKTLFSVDLVPIPGASTSAAPAATTSSSSRTTTKPRTSTRRT